MPANRFLVAFAICTGVANTPLSRALLFLENPSLLSWLLSRLFGQRPSRLFRLFFGSLHRRPLKLKVSQRTNLYDKSGEYVGSARAAVATPATSVTPCSLPPISLRTEFHLVLTCNS